jgi:nitrate reductase NapE component
MSTTESKPCLACGESIRQVAKKCPHCHQIQSKLLSLQYVVPVLAVVLVAAFGLMAWLFYGLLAGAHDFTEHQQHLVVLEEVVHVEDRPGGPYVSCMGRITNGSPAMWRDFYFETAFLNADGKVIDTLSDRAPAMYVRPGQDAQFRVRGVADKGGALYKSCRTRIKSAYSSRFER